MGTNEMESCRTEAQDRLIVALDFPSAERAIAMAQILRGRCRWVKVGLELFCAAGPSLVTRMRDMDFQVFLDLKLHDIPNTVAGAVKSAATLGASLLTLHAVGGASMLEAAQGAAAMVADAPRLLAVTVLTSMGEEDLRATGVKAPVATQVLRLARLARGAGLAGMVCSPLEAQMLRLELGAEPELVVPGIRPAGGARGDQTRVATAADAIASGASRLVVGRPVTQAADPGAAVDALIEEMSSVIAADPPLFE